MSEKIDRLHDAAEAVRACAKEIGDCMKGTDDPVPHKARIVAAIERLLRRDDLREIGSPRKTSHANGSWILYYDPKLMIVLGDRRNDMGDTDPHNHGAWIATSVYAGQVRYRSYARTDDRKTAGKAQLQLSEDRILNAGEVALSGAVPHDIHQVNRLSDTYNLMIVTGGYLPGTREYYDVENGTYEVRPAD